MYLTSCPYIYRSIKIFLKKSLKGFLMVKGNLWGFDLR